ncbi:MAG: hypothetical protein ABH824_05125 [Nanoarchaeota archaeon]|nr:hypothetical protein [Nanoarchaeota archaeon]MBU1632453.1 hypothetical protein [Nanoarchaeota archaeon]MBU1876474.1 hypothetical protein [Nanoarchaeota archaeon]
MVINFNKILPESLENIDFNRYCHFLIHEKEEVRTYTNSDEIISNYGDAKWNIIDLLNEKFNSNFDLHNWINKNKDDEISYFLNEAGSNSLNHSQFKAPYKFHLWLGEESFVIGIEQKGKGFNAKEIDDKRIKDNEGNAFEFFRNCKSEVFFDDCEDAKIVFIEFKF